MQVKRSSCLMHWLKQNLFKKCVLKGRRSVRCHKWKVNVHVSQILLKLIWNHAFHDVDIFLPCTCNIFWEFLVHTPLNAEILHTMRTAIYTPVDSKSIQLQFSTVCVLQEEESILSQCAHLVQSTERLVSIKNFLVNLCMYLRKHSNLH